MMQRMQVVPMHQLNHLNCCNVDSIGDTITLKSSTVRAMRVPKFLRSLYDILQYEDLSILAWSKDGTYFQIFNTTRLETVVLPKYFKHGKFASFQRQLNNFGFRKWTKTQASVCTFSHHHLVRCHPQQLTELISRRPTTDCVRSGADSSSTTRRKRNLTELMQFTEGESFSQENDDYNSADETISTVATNSLSRWMTDPLGILKTSDGYFSASASSEQAFSFSVEELHDIILSAECTSEQQDNSRASVKMNFSTLHESLDLGVSASFYAASNVVAGELFPSIPISWNSDASFPTAGLMHVEQERGYINVKSK